jgi:hypothetical protein
VLLWLGRAIRPKASRVLKLPSRRQLCIEQEHPTVNYNFNCVKLLKIWGLFVEQLMLHGLDWGCGWGPKNILMNNSWGGWDQVKRSIGYCSKILTSVCHGLFEGQSPNLRGPWGSGCEFVFRLIMTFPMPVIAFSSAQAPSKEWARERKTIKIWRVLLKTGFFHLTLDSLGWIFLFCEFPWIVLYPLDSSSTSCVNDN